MEVVIWLPTPAAGNTRGAMIAVRAAIAPFPRMVNHGCVIRTRLAHRKNKLPPLIRAAVRHAIADRSDCFRPGSGSTTEELGRGLIA